MSKGKKTEIEIIQQKPLKNFDKIALNQIQGTIRSPMAHD